MTASLNDIQKRVEVNKRIKALKEPVPDKPLWIPQAGPQSNAFDCKADQIGYGGAAGGGKSDLMLGFSVVKHTRSIIFRRVFPSLRAMIERSREILTPDSPDRSKDSFNETLSRWKFAGGKTIEFSGVQYDQDLKKYQGQPHDFIGFDEATEFPEKFVRFLMGWNRTSNPDQRCRVLFTFNPPMDDTGAWVIKFFAPWLDDQYPDPAEDGEIRYVARTAEQDEFYRTREEAPEEIRHLLKTRTFFHASLKDNPIYMETGYESTIEAMPEPLRSLMKGVFGAAQPSDPWQVLPTHWVKAAQARWKASNGPEIGQTHIAADVARGGSDKTVIAKRHGDWFAPLIKLSGKETPDGATVAARVLQEYQEGAQILYDVVGVGAGVYEHLNSMGATGVNVGSGSAATDKTGKLQFRNLRAELYWRAREALDPQGGGAIALPDDPELLADLCSAKWKLMPGGKIQIESKDDIKTRIGRSPDCGDAVLLTFYQPPVEDYRAGYLGISGAGNW